MQSKKSSGHWSPLQWAVSSLALLAGRTSAGPAKTANIDLFEPARCSHAQTFLAPGPQPHKDICIVNVHGPTATASPEYVEFSHKNQAGYAERHHYKYFVFQGRISDDYFVNPEGGDLTTQFGGGLNWQKLSALATISTLADEQGKPQCRWMMWVDTDAVFTNYKLPLEPIIARYGNIGHTQKHVILAQEDNHNAGCFVNSGVFFVKNSWQGHAFLNGIANMYDRYKNTYMTDQDAFQHYAFNRDPTGLALNLRGVMQAHTRVEIAVAPQRTMDSFYWPAAPISGLWQPCDLLGHIPGGSESERIQAMTDMTQRSSACMNAPTDKTNAQAI